MKIETLAIHAGNHGDPTTGAVVPPLVLSTTFERAEDGSIVEGRDIYTRASNPNRRALEEKLAALEGGSEAIAFASGQAATMSIFHTLGAGSHVILPDDIYYNTRVIIEGLYANFGLTCTAVDMTDLGAIKKAIKKNTKLIWIETPSNPSLKITDIQAVVKIAKSKNIMVGCDNTWATPFFTRPFDFGVDVVMHSTTKYFGGHSDILGGCVILPPNASSSELATKIRTFQSVGGGVPSPFDCWLLNRSLSTYAIRMPIHAQNALKLAAFLEAQPQIEKVNYPGLKSNEYHKVAKKQMLGGFGGMMSILVKGGQKESMALASKLKIFKHATSLGGVESLIEHRFSVEGIHSTSPENLLRISVGIENIDDLIADFKQALA
ncbi:Cys/Met metabolism pyridoxal-phosphate-dependent protein [Emticicia oligotrophica DSM 17448]|uniref:Cys/Met metabolism pyridoxal-phosphate-dependent protein n=1 Tax=Emticicia oligotrophica (strain DSM 17448 / CIP 109782 / MTCC 6937 / GPTSA100-15) TaxID=929562 RepID=A0ABN4AK72_EMTOG|nr:PLP-dependent aspartate aminotransferase family protein [Emticicia oligotrophica]AFK02566.1 Cys/Met metabolism pyridoxal-phosphate-dependent protein [Emticicia oligotrophica DSM 17448]